MKGFKKTFFIFLRGLVMGMADTIPGVSGGTIAFITGIYDRLIHSVSKLNELLVSELIHLRFKKFFQNIKKIDYQLFIPLLLGIGLAVYFFSKLLGFLFIELRGETYAFFFGLVLASAFFVYREIDKTHWRNAIFTIIGFAIGFAITGLNLLHASHSNLILFFTAMISICIAILPGISGSFMMLLLGQYEYVINAVRELLISKLLIIAAGALIGLLASSKVLSYLLKKHRSQTFAFLGGLMLGSLRLLYNNMVEVTPNIYYITIAALIGFFIVMTIGYHSSKKKKSS